MQESLGFGESVSVEVIRANKSILPVIVEVIKKNWMIILIVAIIIYFLWKSKQKQKKEVKTKWQF